MRRAMQLLAICSCESVALSLSWPKLGQRSVFSGSTFTSLTEKPPNSRPEKLSPWRSPISVEAPGLNGGDPWIGARGSDDDLDLACDEAMSMVVTAPVIPQFYPQRWWLWTQWDGTIIRRVVPREVVLNLIFAACIVVFLRWFPPAAATTLKARTGAWSLLGLGFLGFPVASSAAVSGGNSFYAALASIDKVWLLASSLVTFTLSFFLTQSYGFWRNCYKLTRSVQGRLCASRGFGPPLCPAV